MRCVLVCPPGFGLPRGVRSRGPAVLLPLVDRPFLQHVIERLVQLGVDDLDLLVVEHPEAVEALVGEGNRWGCPVKVHPLRDAAQLYDRLRLLAADPGDDGLLLAHGDRLPGPTLDAAAFAGATGPVLIRHAADGRTTWSGWAWLPPGVAGVLPVGLDHAALEAQLASLPGSAALEVGALLEAFSVAGLLAANRAVLDGGFPGLLLTGREVEPGVWLSRNVVLHPLARVVPPVHLGENVRVGADTQVGPHAVLGRDCILDDRCRVERAVVAPGSFVGEALDLVDVLVDRNLLVSAEHGVATTVTDRFILGSLRSRPTSAPGPALVLWAVALALLLAGLPLLVLALVQRAFSRRPTVWHVLDAVVQPAEPDDATWRTHRLRALAPLAVQASRASFADLVLRVAPLLPAVLLGRLRLVGVPPRTADALADLPDDWREVVLRAPAGALWEAHATGARTDDERRVAETVYVAQASLRHDLALVGRYLRRALSPRSSDAGRGREGP